MSQENVEILLGGYEWFRAKGKFPAHLATPDFVWDMSHFEGWPEQQVYEGRLDLPRRQGGTDGHVFRSAPRPRSRGAGGVGDVA